MTELSGLVHHANVLVPGRPLSIWCALVVQMELLLMCCIRHVKKWSLVQGR